MKRVALALTTLALLRTCTPSLANDVDAAAAADPKEAQLPRRSHWNDLTVLYKVEPVYPQEIAHMGLAWVRCPITLFLTERGTLESLSFRDCPEPFHHAAEQAFAQWRWRPVVDDAGTPIRTRSNMTINFISKGGPAQGWHPHYRALPVTIEPLDDAPAVRKPGTGFYPDVALKLGYEGECVVNVTTNGKGRTVSVETETCDPQLEYAARTTAQETRWQRWVVEGRTVEHTFRARVHFELEPVLASPAPTPADHIDDPVGAAVNASIRYFSGEIQFCYEQRLRSNPALAGRVELTWHIEAGRVTAVQVLVNSTGDPALARCMASAVRTWPFHDDVTDDVTWPFVFRRR